MLLMLLVAGRATFADDTIDLARLDSLLTEGRPEEAVEIAEELLLSGSVEPRNVWRVRQRLGAALVAAGRPQAAIPVLEAGLVEAPDDAALHLGLARALRSSGRVGRALGEFEYAVQLEPDRPLWRLEYADALADLNIRRDALEQIRLARRACGDCPASLRGEANLHLATGNTAAAIAPLRRLQELDPSPELRLLLARALFAGDDVAAVSALLDTVPVQMRNDEETMLLVEADRRLGRADNACAWARGDQPAGSGAGGPGPDFWAIVSEICLNAGYLEESLQAIDRALEAEPRRALLHNNRAAILVRLGRQEEARRALATAGRLDPDLGGTP